VLTDGLALEASTAQINSCTKFAIEFAIVNPLELLQRMSVSGYSEHPINAVFLEKSDKNYFY